MPKISMRELKLPVGSVTNSPEFENVCAAPNSVLYLSTSAAMGELRSFIAAKKIDITFIMRLDAFADAKNQLEFVKLRISVPNSTPF